MRYGYARVSTIYQKYGYSLEVQKAMLKKAGAEKIYEDISTGSNFDRKGLSKLLNELTYGDVLIACKLDRIARTATQGATLIQELLNRGIIVEILNIGKLDNSPTGKLLFGVLLAFAEYERDLIIERTQAGKALAREQGKKVDGRPKKYTTYQLDHAMELLENNSYSEVEKLTGISKSTLTREKRKRNLFIDL